MGKRLSSCSCTREPFEGIPADFRPRSRKRSSFREVTCPSCGKEYWTNRETDLCFDCERKSNLRSG